MREAGFTATYTREAQHLPGDIPAGEALETGIIRPSHTSQLAVLTTEEYASGIAGIVAAIANNRNLRLTPDLRVYATCGTIA